MILNTIHHGDCLEWLKILPDKCCDIFTDPIYNVGKDYGKCKDNLPDDEYKKWIGEVLTECKRVAKILTIYTPHNWQYLYWNILGPEFKQIILYNRAKNGFYKNYVNKIAVLLTNFEPEKSDQIENIWEGVQLPGLGYFGKEPKNDHPGYTTLDVSRCVVSKLCKNSTICDPFMGTGTTAIAALDFGIDFIGCEIDANWISKANKRIEQYHMQTKLEL